MKAQHILLIDDDPFFLELTQRILEGLSWLKQVDTLLSVSDIPTYFAQCQLHDSYPQTVFLDLNMEGNYQLELAQHLRTHYLNPSSTPVYILTSSISRRDQLRVSNEPAVQGLIEKPLSAAQLLKLLEAHQATSD